MKIWKRTHSDENSIITFDFPTKDPLEFYPKKVKAYHYSLKHSYSMIEEFKKDILKNMSECRFMPEEIYEFHYDKLTNRDTTCMVDGIEKRPLDNLNCPKISVKTYISSKASNPLRITPPYARFLNLIEPA